MTSSRRFSVPVTFFIYNRPDRTAHVFERIASIEPNRLFLIADGPKNESEKEQVERTRDVVSDISWNCNVERLYANENLGIKRRFVTGLNAVFDAVDRAIILEDDTVPDMSFFRYCATLLDRYKNDDRVMEITGRNQLGTWRDDIQDYHFSYYGGIWGWATWSDCWDEYDPEMSLWTDPVVRDRVRDLTGDRWQYNHIERVFNEVFHNKNMTWDYQWVFARYLNSGLSIVPSQNLVANVGFGEDATHTTDTDSSLAGVPSYSADFPLNGPNYTIVDGEYERAFHEHRPGRWKERPLIYPLWKRFRFLIDKL